MFNMTTRGLGEIKHREYPCECKRCKKGPVSFAVTYGPDQDGPGVSINITEETTPKYIAECVDAHPELGVTWEMLNRGKE